VTPGAAATPLTDREIVRAGRDLMMEVGLTGLTMRRLSARLGVALGATYHHVPTKRDLLLLIARDVCHDVVAPPAGGWDEQVKHIMLNVADIVANYPGLSDFMIANADAVVPLDLDRAFCAILGDAGFSPDGVEAVKSALFFYVTGMSAGGFATGALFDGFDVRRLFEDGLDLLLAGAGARLEAERANGTRTHPAKGQRGRP